MTSASTAGSHRDRGRHSGRCEDGSRLPARPARSPASSSRQGGRGPGRWGRCPGGAAAGDGAWPGGRRAAEASSPWGLVVNGMCAEMVYTCPCAGSEADSARPAVLTDSKLQGCAHTAVPVTGRPSWRTGPEGHPQPTARGSGAPRSCSRAGPAAPAKRDPALHGTLLPNEATGTAGHTRPFPGSYLKPVVKAGSTPPSLGSGSGAAPDLLPTPLAGIQGDFSLSLNQRINRVFVPQMRWWVPGSLRVLWRSLQGSGEGMALAPQLLE